ncbi:MAG: aldolase [Verrucomicrobia bacterium]|nr:aldolase [Verrucomicrobiota bacterium]
MKGREIRQALHEGQLIFATCVTAPSPRWPELLKQAGVDFVFIDTEHIPLGRETLAWMCQTYAAAGIPPVVRVPCPDPFEVAKVLDAGARGVIGPYLETAEQVRTLVGAVRWRPLKGQRLQDALADPNSLEPELRQYLETRNQDLLLIANIESVPAIEKLDEMLSVPGLDAVLIGPHDLSCSLGIPEQYGHPRFDAVVGRIFGKARQRKLGAGIHFWEGIDREIAWSRAGGNLIMHSSDISLFGGGLKRDLDELRAMLGSAGRTGNDSATTIV